MLTKCDEINRLLSHLAHSFLKIGLALMQLTTLDDAQTPEEARFLLKRSRQEAIDPETTRFTIEVIPTIMVYKFSQLSRIEVEAMLGLTLQETRVYQEAKAEGKAEGKQQGRQAEAASLVVRQLTRRLKQELPEEWRSRLPALPLPALEDLGEALLDFEQFADLVTWLDRHSPSNS